MDSVCHSTRLQRKYVNFQEMLRKNSMFLALLCMIVLGTFIRTKLVYTMDT